MKFIIATLFVTCLVLFNFIELSSAQSERNFEGPGVETRQHLGQKPGIRTEMKKKIEQTKIYHIYKNPSAEAKKSYHKLKAKLPFGNHRPTYDVPPPPARSQNNNNYPPMGGPGYPYPGVGFPSAGF